MASKIILRRSMSCAALMRFYVGFILFFGSILGVFGQGRNVIARKGCDFGNLASAGERR